MKKILSIISAFAIILSIASCGSENKTPETDTSGVSAEEDDSLNEATEFLTENYPYYYDNYFKLRSSIPISFVCSVKNGDNPAILTEMYIKDEDTLAIVGYDAIGRETRVVYDVDMGYQIYDKTQMLYKMEYSTKYIKESIENAVLKTSYPSVSTGKYTVSDKEYNGKNYTCYNVISYDRFSDTDVEVDYYFDKETNKIEYIISGNSVSEIKLLSNEIPDESVFEIPSGYTEGSVEELNQEIMDELAKSQETAE